MRRLCLRFLIVCAIAFPTVTEGQCRKRILVYLDVSGSMLPTVAPSRQVSSPYHQTLSALESLFRQSEFLEEGDVVTVVRFGSRVEEEDRAEGPLEAADLVQRLRGNEVNKKTTDFRSAFQDLRERLSRGVFDRQVVLFASDLAHEPIDGMAAAVAIPDWQAALFESRRELSASLTAENAVIVLFRPQARGAGRPATARQVLADFRASFPVEAVVEPGVGASAAIESLAQNLRRSLLSPPALQVSRDSEDPESLIFTVANDNCVPLTLVRLTVRAEGTSPSYFEDLIDSERQLGARQTEGSRREIRRPLPRGDAWRRATLTATVETEEGMEGRSQGTSASWMKYRAVAAVFEKRPFLSDVLRLDLELTGFTDPSFPVTYEVTVGEGGRPLARKVFTAPFLSSTSGSRHRIVLPMKSGGGEARGVRGAIEGAEPMNPEGDRVDLVEDRRAGHHNLILGLLSLLAAAAVALTFLSVFLASKRYSVFRFSKLDRALWGSAFVVVSLLIAGFLSRVSVLNHLAPDRADLVTAIFAVILTFLLSLFLPWAISQMRFAKSVVQANPLSMDSYIRRSRIGGWLPWVLTLFLTALACTSFWLTRPSDSPASRRGEDQAHPRLHVTSDQR